MIKYKIKKKTKKTFFFFCKGRAYYGKNRIEEDCGKIGYHITKPYVGNGYATEAVNAFLPVITRKIGIDEVYGECLKNNLASIQVMAKCGFTNIFDGEGNYQGELRPIIKNVWRKA